MCANNFVPLGHFDNPPTENEQLPMGLNSLSSALVTAKCLNSYIVAISEFSLRDKIPERANLRIDHKMT